MRTSRRLTRLALAPAGLLLVLAAPAQAAEPSPGGSTTTAAPSGAVTMTVAAGLDDLMADDAPLVVDVEISARELVMGTLELDFRGSTAVAVEVPAGGVKEYRLVSPVAERGGLGYEVTLRDDQEVEIAVHAGRARLPDTEVVGLLGADAADTPVRSALTTPLERSVEVVRLAPDQVDARIAPLGYLVAGPGAVERLPDEGRLALEEWVRSGGRLVARSSDLSVVAEPTGAAALTGAPATVTRLGAGELLLVADPSELSAAAWSRILRDTPGSLEVMDNSGVAFTGSLVVAASNGQEASVPALPWLLGGILLFVVLVGPVNMLVLRAIGRPEWSWVTIPALSLLFLGGFWLVGRSQVLDFTANQAAVVVDDGHRAAVSDVGLLVQVATAGEHVLALDDGWQALPSGTGAASVMVEGVVDDGTVRFELDDLGLGATMLRSGADRVALDVAVAPGEAGLVATVTNGTPWTLDAWGVVVDGAGYGAPDPLPAGETGEVEIPGRRASLPEPAVVSLSLPGDTVDYDVVRLLGGHLESGWPDLESRGAYAFGVTTERRVDVAVDGRTASSPGTTLLVRRFDLADADLVGLGAAHPELLAVDGASSVERYGEEIYAYGADAIVLRYSVPAGIPVATLGRPGGQFTVVQLWDWDDSAWTPFAWDREIDPARHLSAGGEMLVRASVEDPDSFADRPVRMSQLALRWTA